MPRPEPQPTSSPRLPTGFWYGDVVILLLCLALVTASFALTPTVEQVSLLGAPLPSVCAIRNLFGVSCPGCGMSRSFTFLAHGDLRLAFEMNYLGPFVFLLVVSQIPYRAIRLARLLRRLRDGRARG